VVSVVLVGGSVFPIKTAADEAIGAEVAVTMTSRATGVEVEVMDESAGVTGVEPAAVANTKTPVFTKDRASKIKGSFVLAPKAASHRRVAVYCFAASHYSSCHGRLSDNTSIIAF